MCIRDSPVLAAASTTQISSTPEELNLLDGSSANSVVNSKAVVYGSSGELAGTLSTAAQTNVTSLGTLSALTVDNMAFNGNTLTTTSANFVIDASHDIQLDADGGDLIFSDAGTEVLHITNSSSDVVLETKVQDKDFIIKGNDGGSTITPFTLDMSAGGDLFLTGGLIDLKNDGSAVSQIKFYCESSNAHAQTLIGAPHSESATNTLTLPSTGGNSYLVSAASTATLTNKTLTTPVIDTITRTGDFTIDASGDILLDADGADVRMLDGGTDYCKFTKNGNNTEIKSQVSDGDMLLKGSDGGSDITALTLDMSAAGAATFANKVIATELDISGNVDIDGTLNVDAIDIDGAFQIDNTLTVGVDDTGYDVKFFGDTASRYWLWDTSADGVVQRGTLTVGVDDTGHDVKFFGATSGSSWTDGFGIYILSSKWNFFVDTYTTRVTSDTTITTGTWIHLVATFSSSGTGKLYVNGTKEGTDMTGNRTRVKVVKNKVAPPFKMTEFDIMYGKGISYAGDLLDLALQGGVVEKMGSWFSYKGDKIAQGREKVKTLLETDDKLMKSVLSDVKDYLELN